MKASTQKIVTKLSCLLLVLLLIPALVLVGAAQETGLEPVCYEHGDTNGDSSVDGRDAIYTLYHVLFHENNAAYPVSQDCDFDGDGDVDSADAIFVLYGSMDIFDDYTLCGTVHRYYEPRWTWNEDLTAVTVEFLCGCGESHSFDTENGVTISGDITDATCTAAGKEEYTASVTFEGQEYTSTQARVIAPAGHTMDGEQSCTEGSICETCGFTLAPLDHIWELVEEIEATCQTPGTLRYACQRDNCCEPSLTVTPEGLANHSFTLPLEEVHVEGCQYQKQYQCAHCDATAAGETFYKHVYTAALTTEASCVADGVMTFTCTCGDSYESAVSDPDAHSWVAGETDENGMTGYTCANCNATKTALCQDGNEATVSSAALKEAELQLSGAIMTLDEATADALAEEVTVSVTTAAVEDLSLDEELAGQIGSNPVYDFSMFSGEEQISQFAGEVTVSIPYTLQEGDDVECIDVWFIDDAGNVTCVEGKYSAGFVTFTTDHFSYYTVTRLTAAQRCEFYGHVMTKDHQDASCTRAGHHIEACKRCGLVETDETLEKLPHTYEADAEGNVAASCTTAGSYAKICSICKQRFTGDIPATGHSFVLDESQSVEATCTDAGREVYVCEHDCGETYTVELNALGHDLGIDTTTEPNCTTMGRVSRTCQRCNTTFTAAELAPLGHAYSVSGWTWAEDYSSASVTLVCAHEKQHTMTLEAVITATVEAPNCTGTGRKIYTAVASRNRTTYEDTAVEELPQAGHSIGESWSYGDHQHYKLCTVCGEKVDSAAHAWGATETLKAADCSNTGLTRQTCGVCGYVKETVVPASGQHSYKNGICSICKFKDDSCDHLRMYKETLDLSSYNICSNSKITLSHCDCGQVERLIHELNCFFDYNNTVVTEETMPDGSVRTVEKNVCEECGLVWEFSWYQETDTKTCTTNYISHNRFSKDGTVIADVKNIDDEGSGQHYANIVKSSVDAAGLGLCPGQIITYTCHCGENTVTHLEYSECHWEYDFENSSENLRFYVCRKCGTSRTVFTDTSDPGNDCIRTYSSTTVFTKDKQEIYRFSSTEKYYAHDYMVTDVTMYGKTCEDGVIIDHVCRNCGEEYRFFADYHPTLEVAQYDLSSYGLCGGLLQQTECPCGQERGFYVLYSGDSCDFYYDSTNALGFDRHICDNCGGYYLEKETQGAKDDTCTAVVREVRTQYSPGGILIATVDRAYRTTDHDYSYTWELNGTSCEDGVKIISTCSDCGYVSSYHTSGHAELTMEKYDLADYGMCGGIFEVRRCPCGENADYYNNSKCNSWTHHEDKNGNSYAVCDHCGITLTTEEGKPVKTADCRYLIPYTHTYSRDGKTVLEIRYQESINKHRYVWEMFLEEGAESCEDGYYGNAVCQLCGQETRCSGTGHGQRPLAWKTVSTDTLCGELDVVTRSCACGKFQSQAAEWFGGHCDFDKEEYDPETGLDTATCSGCGVVRTWSSSNVPGEGCSYYYNSTYTYLKNGTPLLTYTLSNLNHRHTYVYSYEMLGETCEDGYYYYGTCIRCGTKSDRNYGDDCSENRTAVEILYEDSRICGPVLLATYSCPCGSQYHQQIEDNCSWNWIGWDDAKEMHVYRCPECGVTIYEDSYSNSVSGTCNMTDTCHRIYELDGETILDDTWQYTHREHRYVFTYRLEGKTCEDGYEATGTCHYCGKTTVYPGYDHNEELTGYYDLSDYGMCGGIIRQYSCACGKAANWIVNYECNRKPTGNTDANGREEFYCSDCGTYSYTASSSVTDRKNCAETGTYYATFRQNGETVLDLTLPRRQSAHTMLVQSFDMAGDTCEVTYGVNLECYYCGTTERGNWSGHHMFPTEVIDLNQEAPGSCGGIITYERCACGKDTQVNCNQVSCSNTDYNDWSEEDENGITHNFYNYTCQDCGLNWLTEQYTVIDYETCSYANHQITTFTHDNTFRVSYDACTTGDHHTPSIGSITLDNGSQTCEDGIIITYICDYCGYSYDSYSSGHIVMPVESIDLAPYGSVCGGSLDRYACACGQRQQYALSEETKCDLGWYPIDVWINGYVNGEQYTTEGYQETYSNAWILRCAVTDPQCDLTIRMAKYWLVEDCIAREYQTWQLGYDEDANTWEREITIPTGYDTHAYHHYNRLDISGTLADGSTVSGYMDTCSDCNSTYSSKSYCLNGYNYRYEDEARNTLNNGDRKYWRSISEYNLVANDHQYQTLSRSEYTYADGSEYWYQSEYTYDFTDSCKRTEVYTDSDGQYQVYYSDGHALRWENIQIRYRTCSQFDVYIEQCKCVACDYYEEEPYIHREDPTDHNWYWDDEYGYVCYNCGMKNTNGASGSIVLEDMSDADNYIVGYWNRGNIQYNTYISAVLDDAPEGQDDEVILDVDYSEIPEEYTVGYTFSKADAVSAAEAALSEQGYSGSFALRFTFVPVNAEDELDYAITFDSLSTLSD